MFAHGGLTIKINATLRTRNSIYRGEALKSMATLHCISELLTCPRGLIMQLGALHHNVIRLQGKSQA